MSKRKGDVHVHDYAVSSPLWLHQFASNELSQRRGWDPNAVLNWVALAGWGVQRTPASISSAAPDSTKLMSMEEMIQAVSLLNEANFYEYYVLMAFQFDFSAITHRRSVLDPEKLEYINKHHLMQLMQTQEGLTKLAQRAQPFVEAAYPNKLVLSSTRIRLYLQRAFVSSYVSVPYLEHVISVLQVRFTPSKLGMALICV